MVGRVAGRARQRGFGRFAAPWATGLLLLAATAGCAGAADRPPAAAQTAAQAQPASDANDPLEPVNRAIFAFNDFLYALLVRPLADLYTLMMPQEARDGVRNVLDNMRAPIILANDLLQGEGDRALQTTERFLINSTIGLGGTVDVAEDWGIPKHDEDLGQTFAVWGVPSGPYLVLPVLGPSNPRDAIGRFYLDTYFDPFVYYADNTDQNELVYGRAALDGVDTYSRVKDELQKLKETSIDYYAAMRSISRQKREAEIRNGASNQTPLPEINYDFNADGSIP